MRFYRGGGVLVLESLSNLSAWNRSPGWFFRGSPLFFGFFSYRGGWIIVQITEKRSTLISRAFPQVLMGVRDDLLYRRVYIYVSRKIYIVRHLKYSEKLIIHTSRLCLVFGSWTGFCSICPLFCVLRPFWPYGRYLYCLCIIACRSVLYGFIGIYGYLWVIICQITEVTTYL